MASRGSSNGLRAGRQVIVFTHDNRLAAAMRDLNIPATILEVTRRRSRPWRSGPARIRSSRH